MDVSELRVSLTVADFDKALSLYRDALGLNNARTGAPTTGAWCCSPQVGPLSSS